MFWDSLVPVKKENALAYVPGSHLSTLVFDQYNFGDLNPDGKTDVDQVDFSGIAEESISVIDSLRTALTATITHMNRIHPASIEVCDFYSKPSKYSAGRV